jgi:hypothetical protein
MIESSRAVLRAKGFRGLENGLPKCSPPFRLKFMGCGIAFSLALLAFSASAATGSKDPTLRSADAASRTAQSTGSPRLAAEKGSHSLPAGSGTKPVNLNSQLNQLEKTRPKTTNAKQLETKSSNRAEPAPTPQRDKIDFRLDPRKKNGMSNQLSQGSGSKRSGPGRRVTERVP